MTNLTPEKHIKVSVCDISQKELDSLRANSVNPVNGNYFGIVDPEKAKVIEKINRGEGNELDWQKLGL